jgi:hypothetical protein
MPEAAIHKHRYAPARKEKIRHPKNLLWPQTPSTKLLAKQEIGKTPFGCLVGRGADSAHVPAPSLGRPPERGKFLHCTGFLLL